MHQCFNFNNIFLHGDIFNIISNIFFILGSIYDFYGKKIPGLDFVLGASFFFICLMGASTISSDFTIVTYIVCSIYFIHISFNNSVEGGLKDVDHDYLAGAKTLATVLGVFVQNGRLKVTKKFIALSYFLKFIFIFLIILLCIQPEINLFNFEKNFLQIILFVLLSVATIFIMYKFLHLFIFDRSKLKKLYSLHEMFSYFLLIISLSLMIELWPTIFLIFFPFIWYILFNFILFGKFLTPRV